MAQLSRTKARQAVLAAVISLFIVGSAVTLAIVTGNEPGNAPIGGRSPDTVDYVEYAGPADLLAASAGRPLVINFFASWCPPCRAELPDLAAAHAAYGDLVDFVGINFQEVSESEAARLLFDAGITYPIVEDANGDLLRELGTLPTMPTTVFVGADGAIVERFHGLILPDQLSQRIDKIIGGP